MKLAKKIARERKFHRKRGTTKTTNYINAEQFMARHKYCVGLRQILIDVERSMDRNPNHHTPNSLKAVCDHPEDGYCGHEPPTAEQLLKINAKLSFKMEEKEDVNDSPNFSSESVINSDNNSPARTYKIKIGR